MGAFQRLYTYLSQIFDYGNTAIEKRSIFFKRLLPLLDFGREREGVDLSKVTLRIGTYKGLWRALVAASAIAALAATVLTPIAQAATYAAPSKSGGGMRR